MTDPNDLSILLQRIRLSSSAHSDDDVVRLTSILEKKLGISSDELYEISQMFHSSHVNSSANCGGVAANQEDVSKAQNVETRDQGEVNSNRSTRSFPGDFGESMDEAHVDHLQNCSRISPADHSTTPQTPAPVTDPLNTINYEFQGDVFLTPRDDAPAANDNADSPFTPSIPNPSPKPPTPHNESFRPPETNFFFGLDHDMQVRTS